MSIDRGKPSHNNQAMTGIDIQGACEQGQQLLMETRYVQAEAVLAEAERVAWEARDWDAVARLYMPLQEVRRQRRQRCGEGIVALNLFSEGLGDIVDPLHVITNYPHGQLLVAGWGSIEPALGVRKLAAANELYVETFLAAVYPMGTGRAVVIVPTENVALPPVVEGQSIDQLMARIPAQSIVLTENELPRESRRGNDQTYAQVMGLWERLAAPFLTAADMMVDPIVRMEGYRKTIRVDYACELAHQKLSDVARSMQKVLVQS